jgi:hypothetical protein
MELGLPDVAGVSAPEEGAEASKPMFDVSVEEVFEAYKGRREGLLDALTCDIDELIRQLKSRRNEDLYLIGFPDGGWALRRPAYELPVLRPEPTIGINRVMIRSCKSCKRVKNGEHHYAEPADESLWLQLMAVHSDAWLVSSAFYDGSNLSKLERSRLFDLINELEPLQVLVSRRRSRRKNKGKTTRFNS